MYMLNVICQVMKIKRIWMCNSLEVKAFQWMNSMANAERVLMTINLRETISECIQG